MTVDYSKAIFAALWILTVCAIGLASHPGSLLNWTLLAALGNSPASPHVALAEWPAANHVRNHREGTPMTTPVAAIVTTDSDSRWLAWQARGTANDRVTAFRMRILMMVLATGFAVLILSQIL